jgi:Secretion system C-terminal sorting domain
MRKISIFLMAFTVFAYHSFSQKVSPVAVNVSELAKKQAENPPSKYKDAGKNNEAKENLFKKEQVIADRPIPAGARVFKQAADELPTTPNTPPQIETTPTPNVSFQGAPDGGFGVIPPDGGGAVGPSHVLSFVNDYFYFRSKTGTLLRRVTMDAFFDPTGAASHSDPHVKYDHYSQRWIACVIGIDDAANNPTKVAISATSDPLGTWKIYSFASDPVDQFRFNDYPLLGFNQRWITSSSNMFNNITGDFDAALIFVFDKAAMYAGADIEIGINAQRILARENGGLGGIGGNACPVIPIEPEAANAPMYLAQQWSGSQSTIRISSVTGTLPNVSWNVNEAVYYQGGSVWNNLPLGGFGAGTGPQLGDTRLVRQNDSRINNAYKVNGSVWCAHAIYLTAPAEHTAVQWWQVNPTSGVVQRGRVDDPTGARHRSFPSLVVNKNEDVLIGYAVFQSNIYPSSGYVFRNVNIRNNQVDNEVIAKAGLGSYFSGTGNSNRYGDYSVGALDPVDGSLWTMNHYADTRTGTTNAGSKWGLWWAQIIPPSVAAVTNDVQLFSVSEPSAGPYYCNNAIAPKIVIRNGSSNPLTSAKVNYRIDGGSLQTIDFTGNLSQYQTAMLTFPLATVNPGTHLFQTYTTLPNGGVDGRLYNDTTSFVFSVAPSVPMPFVEGFNGATFPPANWARLNPDNDLTWVRDATAGLTGAGAATVNCWNYGPNGSNQRDQLRTPLLEVPVGSDSVILNFAHANAAYPDPNYVEGLEVLVSADCGRTWATVWSKFGADLQTALPTTANWFPTSAANWRRTSLDISQFKNAAKILVKFESVNNFGNNIFLDDINIYGKQAAQRDLTIPAIISPSALECNNPFTPQITIRQLGKATITTARVNYQLDGGTVNTANWTGSLGYGQSVNYSLPAITTTAGVHTFKVWTSLPNGLADEVPTNDTALRSGFTIFGKQSDPLKEGFEGSFQPVGWGVQNPDNNITWARTIRASKTGAASAFVNNWNYATNNQPDLLITPNVTPLANSDSMFLHFQLAAATYSYPGSTGLPLDSLEVLLTTDCGKTYTSVYKKWGTALQTIENPNTPNDPEFYPLTKNQWRNEVVDLTPYLTTGANGFQVVFRNVSNFENNLFIDDINLFTRQVPAKLKAQGYMITPNPFESNFVIQHYLRPSDLRSVGVYNALGQLMLRMEYNGNASSYIDVNMSRFAAGMYTVQMIYENRQVTQRILKTK